MGFRIELVNQDDDVSCIAACIAMVSGESLKHVKKTLGDTDKGLLDVLIGLKKFNLYGRKILVSQIFFIDLNCRPGQIFTHGLSSSAQARSTPPLLGSVKDIIMASSLVSL